MLRTDPHNICLSEPLAPIMKFPTHGCALVYLLLILKIKGPRFDPLSLQSFGPYESHPEKTCFAICEQQRCRSACASTQSDQRLCYSLPR